MTYMYNIITLFLYTINNILHQFYCIQKNQIRRGKNNESKRIMCMRGRSGPTKIFIFKTNNKVLNGTS